LVSTLARLLIDICFENSGGFSSPWRAPPVGGGWPSIAARPSTPPGWGSPPSAPTPSPTASSTPSWPSPFSTSTTRRPPPAPPAERLANGRDFVPTSRWVLFGHHFAAIAGPGPLVGPVLAAQFGYLPGTIWIVIGVVLGGAVQDFIILFASMRRDGKSLGQM